MITPKTGFNSWYLHCAQGGFGDDDRIIPKFNELKYIFRDIMPNDKPTMYLPKYPLGTHENYLQGKEAIIKGALITIDQTKLFRGHVETIFEEFEKANGEGRENNKLVVINWGYYMMTNFLRKNYGFVKEI